MYNRLTLIGRECYDVNNRFMLMNAWLTDSWLSDVLHLLLQPSHSHLAAAARYIHQSTWYCHVTNNIININNIIHNWRFVCELFTKRFKAEKCIIYAFTHWIMFYSVPCLHIEWGQWSFLMLVRRKSMHFLHETRSPVIADNLCDASARSELL